MRKVTGLCELQRICYGSPAGYQRSSAVEFSVLHSGSRSIKQLISHLDEWAADVDSFSQRHRSVLTYAVSTVISVKKINPNVHRPFITSFSRCVEHIWGYKRLIAEIEKKRSIQYDSSDPDHEEKLMQLWKLLKPDATLESRITKQWQDIGFQGDDPKTDFRGMGLLGLENLLFFAKEYNSAASHVLSHSLHPQHGYAFAIVGINITSMAYNLLKDASAKTHVYNLCRRLPTYRVFNQMYCYLFYEFDKYWVASKPRDVMEFTFIKEKFESNIKSILSEPTAIFAIDFVIDTV